MGSTNMKAFITLALVASATAAPQLLHAASPLVHAVAHPVAHAVAHPVVHAVATSDLAEPPPYTYSYAVADDLSQANFQQTESNDGTGAVTGSYSVNLPDGRIQTVTYNANDITGNVATVEYTGEAVYPPAPAGGHVAAAPVAIALPVVHHATHGIVAHGEAPDEGLSIVLVKYLIIYL